MPPGSPSADGGREFSSSRPFLNFETAHKRKDPGRLPEVPGSHFAGWGWGPATRRQVRTCELAGRSSPVKNYLWGLSSLLVAQAKG